MTGGTIAVLGPVGWNLGAGMTGGQAFVFDRDHERLISRLNPDLVDAVRPDMGGLEEVRWLVERHAELTGSRRAAMLLDHWAKAAAHVWHVLPKDQVRRFEEGQASRVASV
jgi:glutamate synthase domain-containing protein 3